MTRRTVLVGTGIAAAAAAVGIGPLQATPALAAVAYTNGNVPSSLLSLVPWTRGQGFNPDRYIRNDILPSLTSMSTAFQKQFGYALPINDGYRSYAAQVQAKKDYGVEAAEPGTSPHGWATAVDIGTRSQSRIAFNDATYNWLKANAAAYGCVHPSWAEPGGSLPEAWHWEFTGTTNPPAPAPEEEEDDMIRLMNIPHDPANPTGAVDYIVVDHGQHTYWGVSSFDMIAHLRNQGIKELSGTQSPAIISGYRRIS